MKVIKILSVVLLATIFILSCSDDDDNSLNTSPQAMESFAKKHFPNNKVIEIKEVIFGKKKTFEVKLEGNIELTFNSDGDLIEVESKTKIPDSLIPSKIRDFVSTHYPNNFIIEWELEDDYQEVKLDNGVELEFEKDDQSVKDKIPEEITAFLIEHFPNIKILRFVKTTTSKTITYEVELSGDTELEFNSNLEIIEIESKTKLPNSVIPEKIRNYVTINYPDNFIISWELEDEYQEIELNDDIELKFELNGDYINSGQGSWFGNEEYSYISRDETTSTVYARTISGYFITSEKIKSYPEGTVAFISYKIDFDDEAQRTMIGESQNIIVYHVTLAGEPVKVDQTTIKFMDAPEAPIVHFENIMNPTFASNNFFGDRWLFPFQVKLKKGETVKANFYKATNESETSSDEIIVDIRLTKFGQAEEGATEKIEGDYAVVNFSDLRQMFDGSDKEILKIKFRFYRAANKDEIFTTSEVYPLQLK